MDGRMFGEEPLEPTPGFQEIHSGMFSGSLIKISVVANAVKEGAVWPLAADSSLPSAAGPRAADGLLSRLWSCSLGCAVSPCHRVSSAAGHWEQQRRKPAAVADRAPAAKPAGAASHRARRKSQV